MKKFRILFLVKKNHEYGSYAAKPGLFNSVSITSKELNENLNVHSKVEICFDGNSIDREVTLFKPDVCVLEAVWVTPAKLREISLLHPSVRFIVRLHSEVPFLSLEGNSIGWIKQYVKTPNVFVAFNSLVTVKDFESLGIFSIYLPNIYPFIKQHNHKFQDRFVGEKNKNREVNIGCFGAIRPFKNQLFQAVGAMAYANKNGKILNFHINGSRIEQKGDSVLKNLISLFDGTRHNLIEHGWLDYPDFLHVISGMDLGLQVSFTESFNIVTADFVRKQVPIIVSEDISWMPDISKVGTLNTEELACKIKDALYRKKLYNSLNTKSLNKYDLMSLAVWKSTIDLFQY